MYNYVEDGDSKTTAYVEHDQEKYDAFMARIEAGEKIEADDWMPAEYRQALIKLISMHGISEIMGALPEKEWVPKAPTLRRKLGIMAKVQDEMGHGQLLLRVVEDLMKPFGKTRENLMEDLLNGDLKFHNVFHMPTKTWADAGMVGWLVDGAAIMSQTNMLDASYGPYQRALQRICQEEVFHAQHGESIIMALAEGNEYQRSILQESLNRWWPALLMFFGPASAETTGSSKQDIMIKYKIRKSTNEELRQAFLSKYLPRVFSLGLTIPDETIRYDEKEEKWIYKQPDWDEFKQIIRNNGPKSKERLRLREIAYENNRWGKAGVSVGTSQRVIGGEDVMVKESDFYQVYEVFSRRGNKAPMQHQFSLLAPNKEMAMVMAQENFMRREDVVDVWVVKQSDIRKMTSEERQSLTNRLDNKQYRTTKGYGYLRQKWKEKEQGMLDEKEIMSWKEVKKK